MSPPIDANLNRTVSPRFNSSFHLAALRDRRLALSARVTQQADSERADLKQAVADKESPHVASRFERLSRLVTVLRPNRVKEVELPRELAPASATIAAESFEWVTLRPGSLRPKSLATAAEKPIEIKASSRLDRAAVVEEVATLPSRSGQYKGR